MVLSRICLSGGIGDGVVIESQTGVVPSLYSFGDVTHEGVECLRLFYQADGED